MALRFNPPPNWPDPPAGWIPPPGWQPDPSWGPVPEGHRLWRDDRQGGGIHRLTWVLALIAQGSVAAMTFLMGLQWGGWTYTVALLQAGLAAGVILWLQSRWRWWLSVIPVVSAAVTVGLLILYSESDAADSLARESAPLEVVVGHVDDDSCVLNRNEVGAGSHDVVVIAESGPATVRILTGSGDVVFERAALPASDSSEEGGVLEVPAGEDGGEAVRLDPGDYLIECESAGGVSSAKLHVVPARPGFN